MNALTPVDTARAEKLWLETISAAERYVDDLKEFIRILSQWRDHELWRAKASSWNEFMDKIGDGVGKSRRQLYDLLRHERIRQELLKQIQCGTRTKNVKSLAKTAENASGMVLSQLAKSAPEERLEIFEAAAVQSSKGIVTAPAVAAAAKSKPAGKEKPPAQLDSTGTKIPGPAIPFWERRNEVQPWLNEISKIKVAIEKAKVAGDSLYSWIGTPAIDALQNAYTTIANAKLYAVCTKCQGWWDRMTGGGCSTCHNTGLISKHQFDVCSDPRVKNIREAANRARA